MSTIGEALRKVQNQRQAGQPPPIPPVPPPSIGSPEPRAPGGSLVVLCLLGALLVAIALLYAWRRPTTETRTPSRAVNKPVRASVPPATGVTADSSTPPLPATPPPAKLPSPTPVVSEPPPILPQVTASVAVVTQAPAPVIDAPPAVPPPVPHATKAKRPTLGAIFYSERRPVATINGTAVTEGEKVGEFLVVKIGVHAVTLNGPDGEFEIELK